MMTILPTPGQYNPHLRQWLPLPPTSGEGVQLEQLTVATMNVWFGAERFAERCNATLALFADLQPDLIALQEVTPAFLAQLQHAPWVQQHYRLSDIYGESVDPYGVLLLSRHPVTAWGCFPLPSAMGRMLLTAQINLNKTPTTIASVHLESRETSTPTRAKQLARIFPWLANEPQVILVGDFNFCSSWPENQNLDSSYRDLWPDLRRDEPGFTEDTTINTMRLRTTGEPKQVRFDRILFRLQSSVWRADLVELLGTTPLPDLEPTVFPSDHFGLLGRFCSSSRAN
jgi:tyrosyl-DNA phosphodiesterase 2